jgi:hypothetical protein
MDTLIERHPVASFGVAMAIAVLLATLYVVLSEDVVPAFPWLTGNLPYLGETGHWSDSSGISQLRWQLWSLAHEARSRPFRFHL